MNTANEPSRPHDQADALVDAMSRLVKMHAVYPSGNPRLSGLAGTCLQRLRDLADQEPVSLIRNPGEFRVHNHPVRIQGVRRDLAARFRTLNLRRLVFRPDIQAPDLLAFVARLNTNYRRLRQVPPGRADWDDLPDTIAVQETEFRPQGRQAPNPDAEVTTPPGIPGASIPPGLQLTYRRLQRLIQQLRALREQMDSTTPHESRAMDVVRLLLETLTEIEVLVPEQAEELIERTLDRFQAALGRVRDQGLPPQVRALLHDVARKFFPRPSPPSEKPDAEAIAAHAGGDEFDPGESEMESGPGTADHDAFVREIDAFLARDPGCPPMAVPDDTDNVELYLSFLRPEESPAVIQSVARRLVQIQNDAPEHAATTRIRDYLRRRLDDLFDHPEVRPLITTLIPAEEVASRVARLEIDNAEQLDAFSRLAEALWPVVLPSLLRSLQEAPPERQQRILATVVRRVGRDTVLASTDWLLEHLFRSPAWLPWLRAQKIPEVLPFFEALFDSPDSRDRSQAWLAVQRYPFRQKAAFWLYATSDPREMDPGYFHTLLAAEWDGEDAAQLFHCLVHTAEQAAFDPDPERAQAAVRALAHADTDQAADALIRVLTERKWGIMPGRPPAVRREARQALAGMRCQKAVYWSLRLKGS